MTPYIDLGGHPLRLTEDRFADGRKCMVAEHTDLPGCVAYAETAPAALAALKEARAAFLESVRRHEGKPDASTEASIVRPSTSMSGAGLELQPA